MRRNWSVNNLCVIFILQFLFNPSHSQNLSVTYSRVKLPIPDHAHRVLYDGNDAVYLLGGSSTTGDASRILRYSISKDSITWEGSLPVTARYGTLQSDWDGNIFYFGAEYVNDNKVVKYSPISNTSSVVA